MRSITFPGTTFFSNLPLQGQGHIEIVKLLLQDARLTLAFDTNCIINASQNGHTEIVKLLLQDARVDPTYLNNYAFRNSVIYGRIEIVKLLLQDKRTKLDINFIFEINNAIGNASRYGYIEIIKLLLEDSNVDLTFNNNIAIKNAAIFGHIEVVKFLAQKIDISTLKDTNVLKILEKESRLNPKKIAQLMRDSSIKQILINNNNIEMISIFGFGSDSDSDSKILSQNSADKIVEYMKRTFSQKIKLSSNGQSINIKYNID